MWVVPRRATAPEVTRIITGTNGGTVRLFDPLTGVTIRTAHRSAGAINALAWTPDRDGHGFYCAAACEQGRICVYHGEMLRPVAEYEIPDEI